jgi:RHS repeat-associated protein
VEYTPYGEVWIEKGAMAEGGLDIVYRFTGKERDEETGLYYYGARYLDAKASRWLSADPALGEYIPGAPVDEEARKRNGNLPGMGGVYNLINLHLYHYAGNNPVKYTDPDGRIDKKVYGFRVDEFRIGEQSLQDMEYRTYYSIDPDRLSKQQDRIRRGLGIDGLVRYGPINGKDRWAGHRRGDPPNISRIVDVGEISEVEVTNVSDIEESVLESGIIEQRYYVEGGKDRLISERSLDADGKFTNEINEIPE